MKHLAQKVSGSDIYSNILSRDAYRTRFATYDKLPLTALTVHCCVSIAIVIRYSKYDIPPYEQKRLSNSQLIQKWRKISKKQKKKYRR